MTWRAPFEGVNPYQIINMVLDASSGSGLEVPPPDRLAGGPLAQYPAYVQLMRACWARDPAQRPTFAEVVDRLQAIMKAEAQQNSVSSTPFSSKPASADPSPQLTAISPHEKTAHACSPATDLTTASCFAPAAQQQAAAASELDAAGAAGVGQQAAPQRSLFEQATQAASQAYEGALRANHDLPAGTANEEARTR
ncbi:hypothetical protein ABPG75_002528 [Micractinium tetrahymenae]